MPFFHREIYPLAKNKHVIPLFCGLIFILGCLLHYQRGYFYNSPNFLHVVGCDDAYIAYRYGWNLTHYGMLGWNESGFRQTEGFTNPLWVFLSSAWALTDNLDAIYPGVTITSVLLTAILLIHLAYRIRSNCSRAFSLTGIIVLSASPILWSHTTSGMESALFGMLIGLIAYISIFDKDEHGPWIEIFVFTSVLLRSDGFSYIFIILAALLTIQSPRWKRVAASLVLGIVALLLWRFMTFGVLTPNTAVAKLNFPWTVRILPGLKFLLISSSGFLPLILVGVQALRNMKRKQQFASGVVIVGWSIYYIYIGGDVYLERHLIGVMVLLACMASYQFDHFRWDRKQTIAILAILTAVMFLPLMSGDSRFEYWKPKPQDPWINFGKEIGKDRERYGVIVIAAAGKIPFFAGGDFVDELGLNDAYLATLKRETFIPGHGAGSRVAALEIARSKKATTSICGFGQELLLVDKTRVMLWVDNINSNQTAHHTIPNDEAGMIMKSYPLSYTLLVKGIGSP